jgi:hypothetical protein
MGQVLSYFPGQQTTIWLQTLDGYTGLRADPVSLPMVNRIILPGFTLALNYPQTMTRLDRGLYYAQFVIPTGAIALGSYLIDVSYPTINALDGYVGGTSYALYEVVVTAPYGNFGTVTVG